MKEKLLVFIPIFGCDFKPLLKKAIEEFRRDYKYLRCVDEVDHIDYTKQCVKCIFIHEYTKGIERGIHSYTFTNSSGRIYRTITFKEQE